jgi:nucleotide-binding universal stress UspA family protein
MKLLIACDNATEVAVVRDDLARAGLPPTTEAVVLSVADLLPVPSDATDQDPLPAPIRRARERVARALAEARRIADNAAAQLHAAFPGWRVSAEAEVDAPAWAIIRKADAMHADLIVVGSHGHAALDRLLLGSTCQTILAQAAHSVRIVRPPRASRGDVARLLVGSDGSAAAQAAVARVASGRWQPRTLVRVVVALDETLASMLDGGEEDDERSAANLLLEHAAAPLRASGLTVEAAVIDGAPKRVLAEEAERWQAECVFVGAQGRRAAVPLLLGSVSAALAARAPCSVEVVRVPLAS